MLEEGSGDETNVLTAVDDGQAKNCEKSYCDSRENMPTPIALPRGALSTATVLCC